MNVRLSFALFAALCNLPAQEASEFPVNEDCGFFRTRRPRANANREMAAALTAKISHLRSTAASGQTVDLTNVSALPTIDRHIFQAIVENGITPTPLTTDYEFIRRVSLDLTGRLPVSERVRTFVADSDPRKREKLIDELMARDEWLEKWTMYFGDLFRNAARNSNVPRFPAGVKAFREWILNSLRGNKPYNRMASELITATGTNSYDTGELNWLVGGFVTGGPPQDIFDQQAANVAKTFLGISHLDCLMCHNGRGHLEAVTLWGSTATRVQAWGMASFLSHTESRRTRVPDPAPDYWGLYDNARYRTDYALNTTSGNRPARQPIGANTTIAPLYVFSGRGPRANENYRVAFAREVTEDVQFARAAVNYMWKEFFGVGIVDPVDQFDPARLDPDKPPAEPWTLQPSHPRLLNDLAQDFIKSGYSLKALMKQIAVSQAYQLSSNGGADWNPAWDKFFARKFVRRLWGEEVHDAIVQTSSVSTTYNLGAVHGTVQWAMQFPETKGMPAARNPITLLLDAFFRGNRDDEVRRPDGSLVQALNLMNDSFVLNRTRTTVANSLAARVFQAPDEEAVDTLFITVLSRQATERERTLALAALRTGNRRQQLENLLWALYNKVDFLFNY